MQVVNAAKPQLVSLRARGTQDEGVRTAIQVRDFTLTTDEPETLGGTDQGPNPMELVLSALVGCASVMLRMIAGEQGLEYNSADFDVRGTLDTRGLAGVPGVCRHFLSVTGTVRVRTRDAATLAQVAAAIEDRCPVFNLLRDAGVDVTLNWEATAD